MATCTLAVLETSVAFKYPLFVEKSPCSVLKGASSSGKIVEPRGSVQHGKASWNACFEVAANDETDGATFGELSYEQQSKVSHRKKAIEGFLNCASTFLGRLS